MSIHLDAMEEIYMMTELNLKASRDICPSTMDHHKTDYNVENLVLLKNHTLTTAFDIKYKTHFESVNDYQIRHLAYMISLEKSGAHPCNTYSYNTKPIRY